MWFNTTFLMNRYGDASREDSICMFLMMFCLYFMAEAISPEGGFEFHIFAVAWAALTLNLIVHWWLKLTRYVNLDEGDISIIKRAMRMLGTQLALILVGLFLGADVGIWFTNAALAVGIVWWARGRRHVTKPTNFDHLAERCCLLVIVTFGEMVVDISGYMRSLSLSHFIVSSLPSRSWWGCS